MACIQYPRKERGGVSLGSYEKPTIYKEPLKEFFTKKKERVEEGDITYHIRNDPSRYNDAIMNYQKGSNIMVEIDYQNRAPQTTTMNFGSASNPYKVNKSFRPPEFSQLDLQPLSRQQRPYTAAQTNIGSSITRNDFNEDRMDHTQVQFSIGANPLHSDVYTTPSHEIGVYYDNPTHKDMIHTDSNSYSIISQLKGLESDELQKLFLYEQTPNGIELSPITFSANTNQMGPQFIESQRNISDQLNYLQQQLQYTLETNPNGPQSVESQRNLSDLLHYTQEQLRYVLQTNVLGPQTVESHRHLSETINHIKNLLNYSIETNPNGPQIMDPERNISDAIHYLQEQLSVSQGTNRIGPLQVELQRNLSDTISHLKEQLQYSLETNVVGPQLIDTQHLSDQLHYTQEKIKVSIETNLIGPQDIELQRNLSNELQYIKDQLQYHQDTNKSGVKIELHKNLIDTIHYIQEQIHLTIDSNKMGPQIENQRHLDVIAYLQDQVKYSHGTNQSGPQLDHHKNMEANEYVQDQLKYSQGTNHNTIMKKIEINEYQEKMKDILLKNMNSSVHIVIQQHNNDEYSIQGNVKDKIGIIVDSAKGLPIRLNQENGNPIKLKDYTWKFVKSATGDKFIIYTEDPELKLERKGELYSVSSNPNKHIHQTNDDDTQLKREVRNITVLSNLGSHQDLDRIDESVSISRIEKPSFYTNFQVEMNKPSLIREDHVIMNQLQSNKKKHIHNTFLKQSQGRYD